MTRSRALRVAAVLALLAGVTVRLLATFPVHEYASDADSLLTSIQGLAILDGARPVYYSPRRIGALESYLQAAVFHVLGASRTTMTLPPLAAGVAFLIVAFLFVRELLGREIACLALLVFAIPSPAFLHYTYQPQGYAEMALFFALPLWLAARMARRGVSVGGVLALGLAVGLGWWHCMLTASCSVPAVTWLAWRRPEAWRRPACAAALVVGIAIGAAPWIAYNVTHRFDVLQDAYAARPAASPGALAANVRYLVATRLPDLLVGTDHLGVGMRRDRVQTLLHGPAVAVWIATAVFFAVLPLVWRRSAPALPVSSARLRVAWPLLAGVVAVTAFLNVASAAGEQRAFSVRYALPFVLAAAPALALFAATLARRSAWLALVLVAVPLVHDAAGHLLPGGGVRRNAVADLATDARFAAALAERGVTVACGDYWLVYPLNFTARATTLGVPLDPTSDYYAVADRAAAAPGRWTITARDGDRLRRWAARAGLAGAVEEVAPGIHALLPPVEVPPGEPAHAFLFRLRVAFFTPDAA